MSTVTLSLVSHTNAGKTTLARTLLAADVGEVRDAPHVTTQAEAFPLVESAAGDKLVLWDTPGFGDSARLARRLAQQGNPIGWFLSQVWDRWRDQAFWLTQQAMRNVRDQADVVLYLVNAAEDPQDAGYLAPELAVLAWMGKPVLALLNQTGPPRETALDAAEVQRWQHALVPYPHVQRVLAFDAFARCWVQEFTLFAAIALVLPPDHKPAFAGLEDAWRSRRFAQFDEAMTAIAEPVGAAACARVIVGKRAMLRRLGDTLGTALGRNDDAGKGDETLAAGELARAVAVDVRVAMDKLIAVHALSGQAAAAVEAHFESDIEREGPLDEGKAAAMGGVLSGAATGLAADLAAGGLTFGAGMLTGAILGALGGAGIARAVNVVRGKTDDRVRWDVAFLLRLVNLLLLRYLAVAHYGRGRGAYEERETPAFWRTDVAAAVAARGDDFARAFAMRADDYDAAQMTHALTPLLRSTTLTLLESLYPGVLPATYGGAHR